MANEKLLKVEKNTELTIKVPVSKDAFGSGLGSDFVPSGAYKTKITECYWHKAKDENKTNLVIKHIIEEGDFAGKQLMNWIVAPIGDADSDDYKKSMRNMQTLAGSAFSALGKFEAAEGKEPPIGPKFLLGKIVFVDVEEDSYKDKPTSRVRWYMLADKYADAFKPTAADNDMPEDSGDTELLDEPEGSTADDADAVDALLA